LKNALIIIILGVFAFNFGGHHLIYKIEEHLLWESFEKKMKAGIDPSELTILTFSPLEHAKLHWEKKHEFEYQGSMYDVVSSEKLSDGTILYRVLPDEKEKSLKLAFQEKFRKQQKQKDHRHNDIKFFKITVKLPTASEMNQPITIEDRQVDNFNYKSSYNSIIQDIASPPPKSA